MKDSTCAAIRKIFRSPCVKIELILVLLISIGVFLLSSSYDLFEHLVAFVHKYEPWNLDEVFTVSLFLVVALSVFAVRRWRELALSEEVLRRQNEKLTAASNEIRKLQGIIPICAACKQIRDDNGYWHQVEKYISQRSDADFSHSLCPDCMEKLYPEYHLEDVDSTKAQPGQPHEPTP